MSFQEFTGLCIDGPCAGELRAESSQQFQVAVRDEKGLHISNSHYVWVFLNADESGTLGVWTVCMGLKTSNAIRKLMEMAFNNVPPGSIARLPNPLCQSCGGRGQVGGPIFSGMGQCEGWDAVDCKECSGYGIQWMDEETKIMHDTWFRQYHSLSRKRLQMKLSVDDLQVMWRHMVRPVVCEAIHALAERDGKKVPLEDDELLPYCPECGAASCKHLNGVSIP